MPSIVLSGYRLGLLPVLFAAIGLFILVLGTWVRQDDPGDREHMTYFRLTVAVGLTMLLTGLSYAAVDPGAALLWDKAGWIPTILITPAVFAFVDEHLRLKAWRRHEIPFVFAALALIICIPTPLFVDEMRLASYPWGRVEQMGWAGYVFLAFFYGVLALSLVSHLRKLREPRLTARQRSMYRLTLVALLCGTVASLDLLQYVGIPWPPLSPILMTAWIILYGVAILRYKLFRLTTSVATEAIIQSLPGSLFVANPEGYIVITNPYAAKMTLVAPEAMHGERIASYLPDAPAILNQAQANAVIGPLANEQEGVLIDGKGARHPVAISAAAILDETQRLRGVVFVAVGIEKLKEQMRLIGDQQEKLETDLEQLERVQKTLVGRELKMVELKKEIDRLKGQE